MILMPTITGTAEFAPFAAPIRRASLTGFVGGVTDSFGAVSAFATA